MITCVGGNAEEVDWRLIFIARALPQLLRVSDIHLPSRPGATLGASGANRILAPLTMHYFGYFYFWERFEDPKSGFARCMRGRLLQDRP